LHGAALKGAMPCKEQLAASGRCVAPALLPARRFPPYLVLLRVGFTLPPALQTGRCALTAPFHPYPGTGAASCSRVVLHPVPKKRARLAEAVSFLWHWPSARLEARIPDVIRHTALRSSDFPPPANLACARKPAATARSSCQLLVYRSWRLPVAVGDFGGNDLDVMDVHFREFDF